MQSELFLGEKYRPLLEAALPGAKWIPDNPFVDRGLSGHADLSLFSDGSVLYSAPYLKEYLENQGISALLTEKNPGRTYPEDAMFNVFCNESSAVFNRRTAEPSIVSALENSVRNLIEVSQGYSACNLLGISADSFITADEGIYRALISKELNVLKIQPGFICLPGFDYGFIGGSAVKPDSSTIAFTGSLSCHPDCDRIVSFIKEQGKSVEFMTDLPVFDIGGAVIRP